MARNTSTVSLATAMPPEILSIIGDFLEIDPASLEAYAATAKTIRGLVQRRLRLSQVQDRNIGVLVVQPYQPGMPRTFGLDAFLLRFFQDSFTAVHIRRMIIRKSSAQSNTAGPGMFSPNLPYFDYSMRCQEAKSKLRSFAENIMSNRQGQRVWRRFLRALPPLGQRFDATVILTLLPLLTGLQFLDIENPRVGEFRALMHFFDFLYCQSHTKKPLVYRNFQAMNIWLTRGDERKKFSMRMMTNGQVNQVSDDVVFGRRWRQDKPLKSLYIEDHVGTEEIPPLFLDLDFPVQKVVYHLADFTLYDFKPDYLVTVMSSILGKPDSIRVLEVTCENPNHNTIIRMRPMPSLRSMIRLERLRTHISLLMEDNGVWEFSDWTAQRPVMLRSCPPRHCGHHSPGLMVGQLKDILPDSVRVLELSIDWFMDAARFAFRGFRGACEERLSVEWVGLAWRGRRPLDGKIRQELGDLPWACAGETFP